MSSATEILLPFVNMKVPDLPALPIPPIPQLSMPDWRWLWLWLRAVFKSTQLQWSALTRNRRADVIVGLTLQCLLMSLQVLLTFAGRVSRGLLKGVNTVLLRAATVFGLVRPLRLLRNTPEVREQLESATLLRIAGYNLVLFEGLRK